MLQAFLITFRDGLEAFLIVAIGLAVLRKSGSRQLIPAVHWGIAVSVVLSVIAAWLLSRASNQALWEGLLAWVAAVAVAALTVHVWRVARPSKSDREGEREYAAALSARAWLAVCLFTSFMIAREGMETALLMGTLIFQVRAVDIIAGAIAGLAGAGLVAGLWSHYGHRVDVALFFQVTVIFLLIFVLQLLAYGLHDLTEANIFTASGAWRDRTELYGPDGVYGQYSSYVLVGAPLAWLVVASLRGGRVSSRTA